MMDFDPFAFEWPSQTQQDAPASDGVSTSPKRKRTNGVEGIAGTIPKRSSPLQQVHTPETLGLSSTTTNSAFRSNIDSLNLMKRADTRSADLAPMAEAVANGSSSSNINTPQRVGISNAATAHLDDDPFGFFSFPPGSTGNFHSTARATAPPAALSGVVGHNLANGTGSSNTNTPTTPEAPPPNLRPLTPSNPAAATTITTLPKTPLHSIPEIAPQYVPTYLSPTSQVKIRDPHSFSINPPFWKRWPKSRYVRLATYLSETIDLTPFAAAENIPIEEAAHLFNAIVVAPLHDETDALGPVAEARVEQTFKTMGGDGAKNARWRLWRADKGGAQVKAELAGVRPGTVQLTGEMGNYLQVRFLDLSEQDREFVRARVGREEWAMLARQEL